MKNKVTPLPKDGERMRFMLVYQGGLANVFRVQCSNLSPIQRDAQRVYQGDFHTAESIAFGCGLAGAVVMTVACNQAGDITNATWTDDLESQPFFNVARPVFFTLGI